MQRLYLMFLPNRLRVYSKNGNSFEIHNIDGNPDFPFDINQATQNFNCLLDKVVDDFNLEDKTELELVLIKSNDCLQDDALQENMDYVVESHSLESVIKSAVSKLRRDKSKKIDQFGINFDGECYWLQGDGIAQRPFSLLAFTVSPDSLMKHSSL